MIYGELVVAHGGPGHSSDFRRIRKSIRFQIYLKAAASAADPCMNRVVLVVAAVVVTAAVVEQYS